MKKLKFETRKERETRALEQLDQRYLRNSGLSLKASQTTMRQLKKGKRLHRKVIRIMRKMKNKGQI